MHAVDLMPTIAELAGAALPESRVLDGRSFAPLLRTPSAPGARRLVYSEIFQPSGCSARCDIDQRTLVGRRWKLLVREGRKPLLFDLMRAETPDAALRPPFDDPAASVAWTELNAHLAVLEASLDEDHTWTPREP